MNESRNPTGWMVACAVILAVAGAVSPSPHGLTVGGALAGGCLAVAAMLAWDSYRQRRTDRIDAARTALPRDADPDESFARRRIDEG